MVSGLILLFYTRFIFVDFVPVYNFPVIVGQSSKTLYIDGGLPDGTVPDSSSSMFVSIEGR